VAGFGRAKIKAQIEKSGGGEKNATSIKRRLRLSKKQRESSSLRRAAQFTAICPNLIQRAGFKRSRRRENLL
jgi:hypothetical protein